MQCGLCNRKMSVRHMLYSIEMAKHITKLSSLSGTSAILVFHIKRYGNILLGTPITEASNARGYETKQLSCRRETA